MAQTEEYYYYYYYIIIIIIIIIIILKSRFTIGSNDSMCTEANGTLYCMREEIIHMINTQ